ncbi:Modification methylase HhaI [Fusobacterium sp. DD29]|uniref:DNA cytosine methyltransferase n=1 Tax=unclassified Fusobacterium TaxID=2648384 RepID=UPI001B8B6510|nr:MULTISPECIES: DNA (cytosine-5-)-methyltransferase [unclassified Fusobacterium]MBR8701313.1 Modification methylase HhaI [Fusobacterium sp. DD45]MBR8711071.1 Modification methylase HhaI [Fusobacterium sp. DD28]MBR8749441.1 Modification methylase HhaI [Fusobacterium sp. DD29]MBR8751645.1 Modification methylase HhaI [Fusobacterium sp. DD26]MBR8761669.1 Modification methylase HhaI [Fusobacterium sp. DD25]
MKILELFGGIGAPRRALINLKIPHKSIDYVEIDEKAVRTYNAMFAKYDLKKPQNVIGWNLCPDILIHGSPCQDFSIAGKQKGADEGTNTRSSLMWETIKIIKNMGVWKPKIVIWENVKNVLSKHMKHNFNKYLNEMEKLGYKSNYSVLNAKNFGIPQNRERVFVISLLGNKKFDFSKLKKKQMKHIKYFLEDTELSKYIVTQPSMLKKINCNKSLSVPIIKDYCYTITTKQMRSPNAGVLQLPNGKYRYLTERECWRLMGFTDEDFEKAAKEQKLNRKYMNGSLYKQAGNSICVPVLEAIFKALFQIK